MWDATEREKFSTKDHHINHPPFMDEFTSLCHSYTSHYHAERSGQRESSCWFLDELKKYESGCNPFVQSDLEEYPIKDVKEYF